MPASNMIQILRERFEVAARDKYISTVEDRTAVLVIIISSETCRNVTLRSDLKRFMRKKRVAIWWILWCEEKSHSRNFNVDPHP